MFSLSDQQQNSENFTFVEDRKPRTILEPELELVEKKPIDDQDFC